MSTESTASTSAKTNSPGLRLRAGVIFQTLGMLPVLVVITIGFHLASGRFLSISNLALVIQQASINAVLACGMTLVILTAGIDLSVGSILAASAMVAVAVSLMPGLSDYAFVAGLLAGLGCGILNGGLISLLRLPPFIVTLGTLTAIRGLARLIGGDRTLTNMELPFAFLGNQTLFGISLLVFIAAGAVLTSWMILRFTVLGMRIYAVGGNQAAAALAGIRVWRVVLFVYAYSGLLAGLGGVMSASRLYSANGIQLGQAYELDAIAAVILGGTSFVGGVGSIWGTVIGALIIAVLTNGLILTGVPDIWQYIIKGAVIIGAVALDRFRMASN